MPRNVKQATRTPHARRPPRLRSAGSHRPSVMTLAKDISTLKNSGHTKEALQAEHWAIESVLKSLFEAVCSGASHAEVLEILNTVIDFCAAHFVDEEQMMRKCGYANLDAHVAAHKQLSTKFVAAREAASGEGLSLAVLDVSALLDRFHEHVNTHDLEFGYASG
jgi:hemerythrin